MRISDWSSDVCSSDLHAGGDRAGQAAVLPARLQVLCVDERDEEAAAGNDQAARALCGQPRGDAEGADGPLQEGEGQSCGRLSAEPVADTGDRKSTRLNSSH